MQLSGRGVAMSLFASLLFAIIQVFAQRLLWSLPVLVVLVIITGHWVRFLICLRRIKRRPLLLLAVIATALIMGSQWMLFVWAPLSGHMLDLTLGYFLMPLVLVLTGRIFYKAISASGSYFCRGWRVARSDCSGNNVLGHFSHGVWLSALFYVAALDEI